VNADSEQLFLQCYFTLKIFSGMLALASNLAALDLIFTQYLSLNEQVLDILKKFSRLSGRRKDCEFNTAVLSSHQAHEKHVIVCGQG